MKVFVTGACGQLGFDVMNELIKRGYDVTGSDIHDTSLFSNYIKADFTNKKKIESVLFEFHPDAVIHCGAWTDVDSAEERKNLRKVYSINVAGTQNIVFACKTLDCKMLYISTDYVFSGLGVNPWNPDTQKFAPLNIYGKSKLQGEQAVSSILKKFYIVRTSWLYGKNGDNFIKTMISLADKGINTVRVVDDQIGTPTYSLDLSRLLVDIIETDRYGKYHATNEGGYISRADFSEEIFKLSKKTIEVLRVSTKEYGIQKAQRPLNSRLDTSKLTENGFSPLPKWKDALARYLKELGY